VDEHVGPRRWRTGGDQSKAPSRRTRTTHGLHDLGLGQRSAAVLVDELEALPGGGKELAGKLRNLLLRRLRLRLAGRGALLELVLQRDLDACLPGWNIDR
jgi:hypothetical protein